MTKKSYETKTKLDPTNKNIRTAIVEELREKHENNQLSVDAFMRESDQVYVFKSKEVSGIRIDCALAQDTSEYPPKTVVYYLQVQYNKQTYANVLYPATLVDMEELIGAIEASMKDRTGIMLLP